MADREQLYTALRNADKAGDVEGAKKLAAYIQSMPADSTEAKPSKDASVSDSGIVGFGAGLGKGVGTVALNAQKYLGKGINAVGDLVSPPQQNLTSLVTGQKVSGNAVGNWLVNDADQGLKKLQGEVAPYKANSPIATGAGELGGDIVATLPVGGILGKVVGAGAKVLGAERVVQPLVNALATSGFRSGAANPVVNALTRTAGGAVTGGASAGLVNPDDAGAGALIGGALPGGVKFAGMLGSGVKSAIGGAAKHSLGMATGAGGEAVGAAYQAGKAGSTNFLDNMRGNVPMTDVLDSAKGALTQMRLERGAQYRSGMADVSKDKTIIDFAPIDKAVASLKSMGNYKGQVINKNASGAVDEIADLVNQWKGLDPAEFHTPEGLDALKQAISDVRDTTQFGTAARKAADTAYNAVKNEITAQAPSYAKVMKDYSQASETLGEIERALSLGNKAAADTSMRKLQSLMRNNVNSNYGNRLDLAKQLEQNGADILPAVAGQAMSSWTPRGLAGLAASGGTAAALLSNPAALAVLPATSPRLVGELAYKAGAANRGIGQATNALAARMPQIGASGNGAIGMNRLAQTLPVLAAPALTANQR